MAEVSANSMACRPKATYHIAGLCHLVNFAVMIPEPHATLQGVIILCAILKIVFRQFNFLSFNAVWALTSGGFRIVSDRLLENGNDLS